jgi:hypothetical protein
MNPELEQKLIEKYPDFFRGRNEPLTQNLMSFGCECGDGWYEIIDTFCKLTQNTLKPNRRYAKLKPEYRKGDQECAEYPPPVFKFLQIKEKFGTLRLYFDITYPTPPENHGTFEESSIDKIFDEVWTTIYAYENYASYLSGRTCEDCGKPGKVYQGGWFRTLCPWHAEQSGRLENEELP